MAQVKLIDIRNGAMISTKTGTEIKKAIAAKITDRLSPALESVHQEIRQRLAGDVDVAVLLVVLHGPPGDMNAAARHLRALCLRANDLLEELNTLTLVGNNLDPIGVYELATDDLRRYGF